MMHYTAHTMTEAGVLVGFKIHNPDGSALLIKCAGGTTEDEAWRHIQNLIRAANSTADTAGVLEDYAKWLQRNPAVGPRD